MTDQSEAFSRYMANNDRATREDVWNAACEWQAQFLSDKYKSVTGLEYVCPECNVERADYEGAGLHLNNCPSCGSESDPKQAEGAETCLYPTQHERFVLAAMHALLSNTNIFGSASKGSQRAIAKVAITFADALREELEGNNDEA